ncbi:reverse transcriptase domain-containing protein [Tanacetum coccineum]|uniref:Reverse transcriptase domain-containing protein n=1 Tax=Tanacetum coccineum TaxID=301880 RepID=A0ABQ4YE19_9ASTR
MPSHIGSYDGKGDPNNYLHLFEGAIRMQKWVMPVACYMFTYTLKDSTRIWWNSQKAGSILNYEDLKAKFQSHFSQQKKFTKMHLAVHDIKQREGESTMAFATRYTYDTLQILVYIKLRNQIEKAVKSGKLSYLVKGIKRERTKATDTQRGEGKKDKGTIPVEAPILMISRGEPCVRSNTLEGPTSEGREIAFPPVTRNYNSSALVIIKAMICRRQVNRVYMDIRSSCKVIYEHCFLKLKPSIRASKVDSKVLLVGFLGEHSWRSFFQNGDP